MKTNKIYFLSAVAIIIAGCGGGGGNNPTTQQRTGIVGDGYIEGAYVCHDSNHDWNCLDETYATTAADGSFVLSNYDPNKDLLVQVPVGAKDNGPFSDGSTTPKPFTKPVWYVYPAGANASGGTVFVGPFSTLVYAQVNNVPGTSVDDAIGIVAANLGIESNQTLGNYLENNDTNLEAIAEVTTGAIANTTSTVGSTSVPNYDVVLNDIGNIVSYATNNQGNSSYDPGNYTPSTSGTSTPALGYSAVGNLHTLLESCELKAFEEWDNNLNSTSNEHKELCLVTDADTGAKKLTYTEKYYNNSTWTLDTLQTSGQVAFLSRPTDTLIDVDNVNSSTQTDIYPFRLFPAIEQSHSGASATFKSGVFEYKLIVSQADINGVLGSNLPKGPSVSSIIDNVTFGSGDKIYKAIAILQNRAYRVDNGYDFFHNTTTSSTHAEAFTVYNEGTVGGNAFTPMANSTSLNSLLSQSSGATFVVDYTDSNNYTKVYTTSAYNPNSSLNVLKIEDIVNGQSSNVILSTNYSIENHNGTPFLIVKDYYGVSDDLFIAKVSSIDTNNYIYGETAPAGASFDITEGGLQNGDIMDDIMVNTSARDRVLNAANIAIP